MVFFDNASSDGSHRYVPADDPRDKLIRYPQRLPLAQIRHGFITNYCQADDIVVYLDGADWLADTQVLSRLNQLYEHYDCSVLYGQYSEANGRYGRAAPYPDEEVLSASRSPCFSASYPNVSGRALPGHSRARSGLHVYEGRPWPLA